MNSYHTMVLEKSLSLKKKTHKKTNQKKKNTTTNKQKTVHNFVLKCLVDFMVNLQTEFREYQ